MRTKILILALICFFVFIYCKKIQDEILPVGDVVIFLDNLSFEVDTVTISLRFREVAGVQSDVNCLMLKFMKEDSFVECGYFAPCVGVPRFGEISWVQKMAIGNSREADVLRIIIQLQTENFEGFSVTKDFDIENYL